MGVATHDGYVMTSICAKLAEDVIKIYVEWTHKKRV